MRIMLMNAGPFEVGLLEAYNHVCHLMTLQRLMAPSKGHRRSENTAAAAAAAAEAAPDDHRSGALEDDEEEPALEEEEEEGGTDVEAEAAAPQQVRQQPHHMRTSGSQLWTHCQIAMQWRAFA